VIDSGERELDAMKSAEVIGAQLAGMVSGDVRVDVFNRIAYSVDASIYRIVPQCVVMPRTEADVVAVVRYAAANGIPIAARGAGSGVAGESLTGGIVVDVRRYLTGILETAADGSWVRVQPGVVLDELSRHLAKWGRKIGPDPSSGNRAVVGGVVANNATGAHSLQYGYISEHVEKLRTVLADGSVCEFVNGMRPGDCAEGEGRRIVEGCIKLLGPKEELIRTAQPATKRNRCAYTLNGAVKDGAVNMARLLTGSEGTLGIFTEITLRTVATAAVRGLVQFEFATFETMAKAVPVIVANGADACELMDRALAKMAREVLPQYRDILPVECAATLLAEHSGADEATVREKIAATTKAVGTLAARATEYLDADRQARLWKSRKDAVPLLNREKSDKHPLAFIEDVSVDHRRLDAYIAGLEAISRKYDFPVAYYGHAGDGELHIRPYLDLRKAEDVAAMRKIAEEVFALAWSLGGTISGEHGDGLLRAAFVRRQYGEAYYELLKDVKQLFDPAGIMNPGKIVNDDPEVMDKNLRVAGMMAAGPFATELYFATDEYRLEVEQCNGCGVCLATGPGARMCPVFRGTGEELATTRAKANLISAWMAAEKAGQPFDDAALKRQLALCVNCKMCSVECPAGVDVSKLVIEARAQLSKHTGFTAAEFTLIHNHWLSIAASTFAPLSNWVMGLGIVRWGLETLIGLDRNRRLPHFERGSFVKKTRALLAEAKPVVTPVDRAVYFVDSFANYNDHALGRAVIDVLRRAGVEVVVPKQRPAPMPAFVYGDIERTRKDMAYNLRQLGPYAAKGYRVVCSEPSAALCMGQELHLIDDSEAADIVSKQTVELMGYLDALIKAHPEIRERLRSDGGAFAGKRIAYHTPCHLRPMRDCGLTIRLLQDLCGLEVRDLNSGCCGLAGTAGMQAKNRGLSTAIGGSLKAAIEAYKPDVILTECAACKMQIETLCEAAVLHPITVISDSLRK
jgi:FAD/FMN-containing dehydrogenase/Fe-S oxidoreductase